MGRPRPRRIAGNAPDRGPAAVLGRAVKAFLNRSFVLGLSSRLVPPVAHIAVGLGFLSVVAVLVGRALARAAAEPFRIVTLLAVAAVIAFPLGYVVRGVLFPWYLWPFSVLAWFLIFMALARAGRPSLSTVVAAVVAPLSLANLVLMANVGNQEASYRSGVGRFIAEVAEPGDTLLLEPAGYIPYFAGLKTWDTVGLVSPDILEYRRPGGPADWWLRFVEARRPTFIVERAPIHEAGAPDGPVSFDEEERRRFRALYELVRRFNYRESLQAERSLLTPIFALGDLSDLFVYRLRPSSSS